MIDIPRQAAQNVDTTCPACGAAALYVFDPDRYFHLDGSANRPCWVALASGRSEPRTPITLDRRTR